MMYATCVDSEGSDQSAQIAGWSGPSLLAMCTIWLVTT